MNTIQTKSHGRQFYYKKLLYTDRTEKKFTLFYNVWINGKSFICQQTYYLIDNCRPYFLWEYNDKNNRITFARCGELTKHLYDSKLI